jgi:putative DNA primase/helicase
MTAEVVTMRRLEFGPGRPSDDDDPPVEVRESAPDEFEAPARISALRAYGFAELRHATFPARPALLCHGQEGILRAGDIAMLFAERGTGKSLLALSMALAVASGRDVLKWHAPEAAGVLVVDGEMPAETIRSRTMTLAEALGITENPPLTIVAADWQPDYLPRLDSPEGQARIDPFITDDTALIVLDNASTLFDVEAEIDPSAWGAAQAWLLSLRRRGKATLLIHHANRLGGARGHSRREDIMDVILKLSRPSDYCQDQGARFLIEFPKARGFFGKAAEPFIATLTSDGWVTNGTDEASSPDADLRQRILEFVSTHPGSSKNDVIADVVGNAQKIRKAIDTLGEEGRLRLSANRWNLA